MKAVLIEGLHICLSNVVTLTAPKFLDLPFEGSLYIERKGVPGTSLAKVHSQLRAVSVF